MNNHFVDRVEMSTKASNILRRQYPNLDRTSFMALRRNDILAHLGAGIRVAREIEDLQDALENLPVDDGMLEQTAVAAAATLNALLQEDPALRYTTNQKGEVEVTRLVKG